MFVPLPKTETGTSGSPVGNSYVTLWWNCRRKWFAKYLWPHPDGARGLDLPPGTLTLGKYGLHGPGANLMMGSLLHTWKEHWYRSGVRHGEDTGQYDLGAGLVKLEEYALSRRPEFRDQEAYDWALNEVHRWAQNFHRFYGPEGHTPLWPTEKILCFEDGTPAVEAEFAVPLGYRDFVFTCRLDAIALYQDTYLVGLETKSAAPSWVDRYISQLPHSPQFTGELFVLRNHPQLKDLPWDKIKVTYHLKGWEPGKKSVFPAPAKSGDVSRTPPQLERFRTRVITTLAQIEATVEEYEARLTAGEDPEVLRDALFPETGEHTGHCYAFNSTCEFDSPCRMGFSAGSLGGYRPARRADEPVPTSELPLDES